MVRSGLSSSASNSSHSEPLETGPEEPFQPRSFQHLAAPAAPRITYSDAVHMAISPEVKSCRARSYLFDAGVEACVMK